TEGTVSTGSLTFTPGNWSTAQTVTVTGADDALADGNIAYTITTGAAVSTDPGYNGLDPNDVAAVTNDDEVPVNTSPPPVVPPPITPPPVVDPPPVQPPPLIEPAPPPESGQPDDGGPAEGDRSATGSGTAQPNTPTVATTFLAEETAAVGSGSGDNDLPYGDRDRSRPSLTERAELPVEAPPVQLAQVVAAAEEIKLPEMAQPALWGALDLMTQQMNDAEEWREQERERQVTLQATTGVAFTLSAGFVTWLLRAGTLATSLLSSMPLWRGFDPLPVLGFAVNERKRLKVAAGRLQADEARADPNVERLFDRASQPKKKAPRKARFKGKRRVTPAPST
nr:hypothetical protein [Gammaproteobacteria bacterium]